jgi:hypothetical protein
MCDCHKLKTKHAVGGLSFIHESRQAQLGILILEADLAAYLDTAGGATSESG